MTFAQIVCLIFAFVWVLLAGIAIQQGVQSSMAFSFLAALVAFIGAFYK